MLCMDIMSIRIYGQVHVEKNCSASVRLVMLYAVSLCNVAPCIASWTRHVLWKISNLLIPRALYYVLLLICIAKGGRIKLT